MPRAVGRLMVLVVFGTLPAQQRKPGFACVVDAAGKPIANAEVTCVHTPFICEPGVVEVLAARSDEHGRCRFDLVVGLPYSMWAIGPVAANGSCMVSAVNDRAAAGRALDLELLWSSGRRQLRVVGTEPW